MISLANPTRFLEPRRPHRAVARGRVTLILLGIGLYLSLFVAPPDYQQGETVKIMFIHVPAAWLAMFGYMLIAVASARHAHLAPSARRRRRQDRGPDRRHLHLHRARHRLAVGQADVGHLLGVGRAADLGARAVPALSRPDRAVAGDRGAGPRRPRRRDPRAGRRRQRADHQFLGGCGGTRCISRRACSGIGRPDHRSLAAHARSSSWPSPSRCSSCCCT